MDAKAKINLREGIVELEGSEEFVKKYLDEFKSFLSTTHVSPNQTPNILHQQHNVATQGKQRNGSKAPPKGVTIAPISVDLKSHTPTLRDLYKMKKPINNQEETTLFVYYLIKKANLPEVMAGHIVTCYNEVSLKKPLNIPQLFRDITHKKGWLEASGNGAVRITIGGENLVEHDLPRNENVKPSQIPVTN